MITLAGAATAIERLYRRLLLIIGRGRIGLVDDSGTIQLLQVRTGPDEIIDNLKRLSEYGFASNPLAGADAVVVFMAGDRSSGVVIATGDQRYRLHLENGEVAIHDDLGQKVHLTRTGIVLKTDQTLRLDARNIEIHATESLKYDVSGRGYHLFPTYEDSWTNGSIAGSSNPITPTEIG